MALYRHGMCRTSLSLSWCHKVSYSISLKVKTEQREFIMRLIKPDGERLLYHHTEIFHNLETRILSALSLPLNWIPFISGSFFVCCAHCIECSVKFFSTQPLFPTRSWLIFFKDPTKSFTLFDIKAQKLWHNTSRKLGRFKASLLWILSALC